MSLAINLDHVTAVLLADGWHTVVDKSFVLDSYEFITETAEQRRKGDFKLVHGGGDSGICATGFACKTEVGDHLAGPLPSVLAVRFTDPNS